MSTEAPELTCTNGNVMIFDPDTVMWLRQTHRILGNLEGSHPSNPMQNVYRGLPLILMPEEATLLVELDAIRLTGDPLQWPKTPKDYVKYKLFKELHQQRGYYIINGIKFGGDYLLYTGDPFENHSPYVASLLPASTKFTPRQLVAMSRLCTQVKKAQLLCEFDETTDSFTFIELKWSKM